uniref:Solute carrier organic anion transporter family member n=1 Tax=Clastoptera arizonana TaxID=38151 RepID=A0A1B6CBJ9_9HEMI
MATRVSKKENETNENQTEIDENVRCGFMGYYPPFIQILASKKAYVLIFGLVGMVQYAMDSYTIATLSTLERRFKIPSKISGFISCSWDIGTFLSAMVMAYIGSRGHKTRWVAFGTFISGVSSLISVLPHIIYGPGEDALAIAMPYNNITSLVKFDSSSICGIGSLEQEDCSEGSDDSFVSSFILVVSNMMMGASTCMYWTLGVAYLDDNVRKNKIAWLLAISVCLRMLGPTLGSVLASIALEMYIEPSLTPRITTSDPRWIGAWWFGWIPFGILSILLAFTMALFPRQLPRAVVREKKSSKKSPVSEKPTLSIKDFNDAVKRLISNRILMFNVMSSVFYIFGLMAYWTFMPKYIETQFRTTSSEASLITGAVGLLFTALGVMVSGAVISRFKPRPRVLAAWNVLTESLDAIGIISFAFIGCSVNDLHGSWNSDGTWNLLAECNSHCNCGPSVKYEPICSSDKTTTFYSPCHAGCTNTTFINNTKMFTGCSCIPDTGIATESFCPTKCYNSFLFFLVLLCILNFFAATGRAGNAIIQFRAVSQDDKSISIGFAEALSSALTYIPAPVIYGSMLDYSCMVWGQTCGETGNCWLYYDETMRYILNFTSGGFVFIAVLLDCAVWYYVKGLQIYDNDDETDKAEQEEMVVLPRSNNERSTDDNSKEINNIDDT